MGSVTEKLRNIKKITDILKSMSAEYVKELVITLSQKSDYKIQHTSGHLATLGTRNTKAT